MLSTGCAHQPPPRCGFRHSANGLIGPFEGQDDTCSMPKWSQDDPKMAPRWSQDGPKMASWRVLEPLGGQDGPKMEPRGFQGRKSQFVPPMLGLKLGTNFGHFWHQSGLQEASRGTWMTCCVKTPILKRKWASQDTSGHEKSSKTIGGVSKIRVCMFTYKVALGRDLGTIFG
mgnify:FL=1